MDSVGKLRLQPDRAFGRQEEDLHRDVSAVRVGEGVTEENETSSYLVAKETGTKVVQCLI